MWYAVMQGRQQGPYPWDELLRLAAGGALKPEDLVWHNGLSGWARADQISGLFSGSVPAPPVPAAGDAAAVNQKRPGGFGAGIMKALRYIHIGPIFRINWFGIIIALLVVITALVLNWFGHL